MYYITTTQTGAVSGLYSDELREDGAYRYAQPPQDALPITDAEGEILRRAKFNHYRYQNGAIALDAAAIDAENAATQKEQDDVAAAKNYAKLKALAGMSPAQVQTWVQNNVTNLAQAQDAIATLAIAVSILARRL